MSAYNKAFVAGINFIGATLVQYGIIPVGGETELATSVLALFALFGVYQVTNKT